MIQHKNRLLNIYLLRCDIALGASCNGRKILNTPAIEVRNIKMLIGGVISKVKPQREVSISQLVLDLGSISSDEFDAQFSARLAEALIEHLIRLPVPSEISRLQPVAGSPVENKAVLEIPHDPNSDIDRVAYRCLHPATLLRLMKTREPDQLRQLLEQLAEKIDGYQQTASFPVNQRITASQLSLTALVYLLNDGQGVRWLSEHYPQREQLKMWREAIITGEITAGSLLHLLDVQNLPNSRQLDSVIHRWLLPLWQQPAVQNIIGRHFGREVIARTEKRYKTILSPSPSLRQAQSSLRAQSVGNAGVVLLWPLLPQLFSLLSLIHDGAFISEQTCWQAALSLDRLAGGDAEQVTEGLTINKLLCGLSAESSLPEGCLLSTEQQRLTDEWLTAVCQQLPGGKKLYIADIRALFLQRPGEILTDTQPPRIAVQHETFDYLLRDWPWPLTLATFPWLDQPLTIVWPLNGLTG